MRNLLVVTSSLPQGQAEAFLIPEIARLATELGAVVAPVRPRGEVFHRDAAPLAARAWVAPVLSPGILLFALGTALAHPGRTWRLLATIVRESRRPGILAKNLAVLPKGLWLASLARNAEIHHVHACWASTPATVAMIAAGILDVPWSFTAHRWDIAEDNLLAAKMRGATFARAIDRGGAAEIAALTGVEPAVVHLGVEIPTELDEAAASALGGPLRLVAPAVLVAKKGHADLLDAMAHLATRGVDVTCDLAGDGPLRRDLEARVRAAGLTGRVRFLGMLGHDAFLADLDGGRWDAAILPSIVTRNGEKEGIPVALIEAMARGLPVVSTTTGGIPELVGDDGGILVPPGDPAALAEAIARLAGDAALRARLGARARARVRAEFEVGAVVARLRARFESSVPQS